MTRIIHKLPGNIVSGGDIDELVRELQFAAARHMRIAKRLPGHMTFVTNYPEPHYFSIPFGPFRELFYAEARTIAREARAAAIISVSEAWGASYARDDVEEELRRGRLPRPAEREDREEIVMICVHSKVNRPRRQLWMGKILRTSGRPHLAPFKEVTEDHPSQSAAFHGDQFSILEEA